MTVRLASDQDIGWHASVAYLLRRVFGAVRFGFKAQLKEIKKKIFGILISSFRFFILKLIIDKFF